MLSTRHDRTIEHIALIIMLAISMAHFILFTLANHLNHDVAWILQGAVKILSGAEFGRDIVDVNPPLIWWLSLPAAMAQAWMDVPLGIAFKLQILLLVVVCAWLTRLIQPRLKTWQLMALVMILLVTPGYHFGQREHVMVILSLPYLTLHVAELTTREHDSHGRSLRLLIGILAGLAFSLKPYFLFIPLLLEARRVLAIRNLGSLLRAETVGMVLAGLSYAVAVAVLAPAYVSEVVPGAMTSYGAYANPMDKVAISVMMTLLPAMFICLLLFRHVPGQPLPSAPLWLAGAGAALGALLQSKGWAYHLLPITLFGLICIVFALPRPEPGIKRLLALMLGGILLFRHTLAYLPEMRQPDGQEHIVSHLAATLSQAPEPRGAFAFITSPRVVHPAMVAAQARWAGRACCVYLLPAAVRRPTSETSKHAERQLREILHNLREEKPAFIIVDIGRYKLGFGGMAFDYLPYLRKDKEFAAFLALYIEKMRVGDYLVMERKSAIMP